MKEKINILETWFMEPCLNKVKNYQSKFTFPSSNPQGGTSHPSSEDIVTPFQEHHDHGRGLSVVS